MTDLQLAKNLYLFLRTCDLICSSNHLLHICTLLIFQGVFVRLADIASRAYSRARRIILAKPFYLYS
jgi:hypothetical protein